MRPFRLSEVAAWCEARLVGDDREASAVATDTRVAMPGALFAALRGEHHDAHEFVPAAAAAGAVALLVSRPVAVALPQLLCGDVRAALGDMAAGMAATRSTRVLALTGSNGKTSVKTLLHTILASLGRAYANPGNRNNEIGLPLALLDQPEDAEFGIYEMGAGQPGDIAYLAAIARPAIALVNNVGPAHLERMGSLLGIARTKGAIYEALPPEGIAVINADDAFAPLFAEIAGRRITLRFGVDVPADVRASRLHFGPDATRFRLETPAGEADVVLAAGGRHQVSNALAAATMALAAGASPARIADGLGRAEAVPGRQTPHRLAGGALLLDDSYNANPGSVSAAIATLALAPGERWLVLGDMRELGARERELHAEVGRSARSAGLQRLYTVGPLSAAAAEAFGAAARHFATQAELIEVLGRDLQTAGNETRCLVKGSRGSRMDLVVSALRARDAATGGSHAA